MAPTPGSPRKLMIEKLQKLITHERSARKIGSIAEAESFAAKIQELLFASKLSMSEVEIGCEEQENPVEQQTVAGFKDRWTGLLAVAVAEASFCKCLRSRQGGGLIFIGRETDRQTTVSMFHHLVALGRSICGTELSRYKQTEQYLIESSYRPGFARAWRMSFLYGYATALATRLSSERKALAAKAQSNRLGLLYIARSEAAIDAYIAQEFCKLRPGRQSSVFVHGAAYGSGYASGSRVSTKARGLLA